MKYFATIAAALLLGACATEPASSANPADTGKEYRTGSNIPTRQKEGVVTMSPEEMERQRNAATGNMGRGKGN